MQSSIHIQGKETIQPSIHVQTKETMQATMHVQAKETMHTTNAMQPSNGEMCANKASCESSLIFKKPYVMVM